MTFGNTTSLPLLLTQSLKSTGILKNLLGSNTHDDLDRIRSYFLVFSVVINVLTFGEGERALNGYTESGFPFAALFGLRKYTADATENGAAKKNGKGASGSPGVEDGRRASGSIASEGTVSEGSMEDGPSQDTPDDITPLLPGGVRRAPKSLSRRIVSMAKRVWHASPDPLKRLLRPMRPFLNSTSLGAAAGILIGLTPPLHRLFFSDLDKGGYFQAWLTTPLKNVGELFVTLQIIVVGVSLSLSFRERKRNRDAGKIPRRALAFVLLMRFVVFPA
ncbi:hypothetical protein IMZ48_47015 [Candidatus Bathyarchaeota archaeon]|nr:hypothetical protein [Candidatus Bathyarchaeota archaeon]